MSERLGSCPKCGKREGRLSTPALSVVRAVRRLWLGDGARPQRGRSGEAASRFGVLERWRERLSGAYGSGSAGNAGELPKQRL